MATHRSTWKARERSIARSFGAERQVGSGSGGRKDQTCSDSTHKTLFIEAKLRAASAARTLWEKTAALAKKEGKIPVVAICDKHKPGWLLVVHCDHLAAVAAELVEVAEEVAE